LTFFLLNAESLDAIRSGRTQRRFEHEGDGYFYDSAEVRERAVAYREADVLSMLEEAGFRLRIPIHHGRWAGHRGQRFGQDVVVVERALPLPG
jgi:hypothetical protein